MYNVTRTGIGILVQTNKYIGAAHELLPNSTVNESLTDPLVVPFQPSPPTLGMELTDTYDSLTDTDNLKLRYMVIGNLGHRFVVGPPATTNTVPHAATDCGLYGLIPFVARPVTNDLTSTEREKYRLRKTMTIGGILYAVYYARVIDITAITSSLLLTSIVGGTPVTVSFVPTINNLRPPQPSVGIGNDGSYLSVSSPIEVNFTDTEVTMLKDACQLIYGDSNYAIISEIGFCTGVEKVVTDKYPNSGTQTPVAVTPNTYYEAVAMQINMIASAYYPVASTNAGFDFGFDLGAAEPLYGEEIS